MHHNFKYRLMLGIACLLLASPAVANETPDRGWYCDIAGGRYGVVEWNAETYALFGSHGFSIPLSIYAAFPLLLLLPIWIVLALGLGYRAFFFSDDLYRAREEHERAWFARHSNVLAVCSVVAALGFVAILIRYIRIW